MNQDTSIYLQFFLRKGIATQNVAVLVIRNLLNNREDLVNLVILFVNDLLEFCVAFVSFDQGIADFLLAPFDCAFFILDKFLGPLNLALHRQDGGRELLVMAMQHSFIFLQFLEESTNVLCLSDKVVVVVATHQQRGREEVVEEAEQFHEHNIAIVGTVGGLDTQ